MTKQTPFSTISGRLQEQLELKTDEEVRILEEYASKLTNLNQLALGWSEDYTDTVNLEDELAKATGKFIFNENNKATLGGQEIEFIKTGKTYSPYLCNVKITGALKHKLTAFLTQGAKPILTIVGNEAVAKYQVQYSAYALEVFVFKNGNSFYKTFFSAEVNKKKNTLHRPKTYSYEESDRIDGSMFPDIEFDMLEKALELEEELENLAYKSEAVAKALQARREDKVAELELKIRELEAELEEE